VKLFGPLHDHDPPLSACGPRLTVAEVELTVTLVSWTQAPFVKIPGVIVVATQVLPLQAVIAVANTAARTIPNVLKMRRFMLRSLMKMKITKLVGLMAEEEVA